MAEVDLLGEPRLKNGLTYYPGVMTHKGSVILGNVVRLQLQAEGAQPYIGYGFLKGLWLWRDQPYIRVQYMAPSRTDLPKDAICYRQEPDPAAMPELMVTNRVGDLHLNALIAPVFIEGGPLLAQLFQENVGQDADGFNCNRHLDPAVQRVQPLDEAFRLTPIVQAFPKSVLRLILAVGAPVGEDGTPTTPMRVPASLAAAAAAPAGAGPTPVAGAMGAAAAARAQPGVRVAASPATAPPGTLGAAATCTPPAGSETAPLLASAAAATPMPPTPPAPNGSAAGASAQPQEQLGDPFVPHKAAGASAGFGPAAMPRTAILLQATYRGVIFRPSLTVRCPNQSKTLSNKLAGVFGLVASSVRIVYQAQKGEWRELNHVGELPNALEAQPDLKALPVQVSGTEMLHLPLLHVLVSVIALANLAALSAFGYFVIYLPQLPVPWSFAVYLPAVIVLYNGYAAQQAITEEYLSNDQLRNALARKDGWLVLLLFVSLLGPDALILFCRWRLPPLGCNLTMGAERDLTFWAFGQHLLQDLVALSMNVFLHARMNIAWDDWSRLLLLTSTLALTVSLLWHVFRVWTINAEEDDLPEMGTRRGDSSRIGSSRTPTRRTLRTMDTSKYIGLAGQPIIGQAAPGSMYEA